MSENVIPLLRPIPAEKPPENMKAEDVTGQTIINLMSVCENLDTGLKMAVDALVQMDKRVRALELAQRKAERKKVPVIVNQHGERAN